MGTQNSHTDEAQQREIDAGYVDFQYAVDYEVEGVEFRVIVIAAGTQAVTQWIDHHLTNEASVNNVEFVPR